MNKLAEIKRVKMMRWLWRSICYSLVFIGTDILYAAVQHRPQHPSRWVSYMAVVVVIPWLIKKPLAGVSIFLITALILSSISMFAFALIDTSLHVSKVADDWILSFASYLMMAPAAVITTRWLRRREQRNSERAAL